MEGIKIDPEFKALIPPLKEDERRQLEENILNDGCRDPLVVWHRWGFDPFYTDAIESGKKVDCKYCYGSHEVDYGGDGSTIDCTNCGYSLDHIYSIDERILLDGHNRLEICERHGLPYKIEVLEHADDWSREDVIEWILENQLGRRNLTDGWRFELTDDLRRRIADRARENLVTPTGGPAKMTLSLNDKVIEPVNTQAAVAEELGWSTGKVAQADYVRKRDEEAWEKVKTGEESVGSAYREVKAKERDAKKAERAADIEQQAAAIVEMPVSDARYHVIVIDPPWPYGTKYDPNGRRAANPYPEMSLDEIRDMDIPAADDCVMWLWTTHKFMRHSFDLLDAWGFRDVAILTWVKDRMGLGTWLRSQSEFCIMAVKGSPVVNLTNETTVISGPLREHSRKPDEFYDMVDRLCVGAKIDFFSREPREGWAQFGNDPGRFAA